MLDRFDSIVQRVENGEGLLSQLLAEESDMLRSVTDFRDLAASLNSLSVDLSATGDLQGALDASREAVDI